MKRNELNFIVDLAAFASFTLLTVTGVLMRFQLPPGSGRVSTLWGLDRHEWGSVHFWISIAFFAILAIHLALHWQWIVRLLQGKRKEAPEGQWIRPTIGLVGLIGLAALSASILLSPVETSEKAEGKGMRSSSSEPVSVNYISIRGSMTLREIETLTGTPAQYIIQELDLEGNPSIDEKLGPLSQRYAFSMSKVRDIVDNYEK